MNMERFTPWCTFGTSETDTSKNGISNLFILLKSALKMQEMPFQRPKFQISRVVPQNPLKLCHHYGLPLTKNQLVLVSIYEIEVWLFYQNILSTIGQSVLNTLILVDNLRVQQAEPPSIHQVEMVLYRKKKNHLPLLKF